MFKNFIVAMTLLTTAPAVAQHPMQHGFILSHDGSMAAHLVATGHHSRQVVVEGCLQLSAKDRQIFADWANDDQYYMLFQAQDTDLPSVVSGMTLRGHIVAIEKGTYDPTNVIIKEATYRVAAVPLNVANPFFID